MRYKLLKVAVLAPASLLSHFFHRLPSMYVWAKGPLLAIHFWSYSFTVKCPSFLLLPDGIISHLKVCLEWLSFYEVSPDLSAFWTLCANVFGILLFPVPYSPVRRHGLPNIMFIGICKIVLSKQGLCQILFTPGKAFTMVKTNTCWTKMIGWVFKCRWNIWRERINPN